MQPRTWTSREEARRGTRVVVTRPGIYDIGTLRIALAQQIHVFERSYDIEHITTPNPERQAVLRNAIADTRWAQVPMAPMTPAQAARGGPAPTAMAPEAP